MTEGREGAGDQAKILVLLLLLLCRQADTHLTP